MSSRPPQKKTAPPSRPRLPHNELRTPRWGLSQARAIAQQIASSKPALRALIRELFGDNIELRKRAADVARRITDRNPEPLHPFADELAGLLDTLPPAESRTRWHLGLVIPRIAHTREQRLRAARSMDLLAHDESNVVRCSAIEGLGLLAINEPSLRPEAEDLIARSLHHGTLAMKNRARTVQKLWARADRTKSAP